MEDEDEDENYQWMEAEGEELAAQKLPAIIVKIQIEELLNKLPEKYSSKDPLSPLKKGKRMEFVEFMTRWKNGNDKGDQSKAQFLQIVNLLSFIAYQSIFLVPRTRIIKRRSFETS